MLSSLIRAEKYNEGENKSHSFRHIIHSYAPLLMRRKAKMFIARIWRKHTAQRHSSAAYAQKLAGLLSTKSEECEKEIWGSK